MRIAATGSMIAGAVFALLLCAAAVWGQTALPDYTVRVSLRGESRDTDFQNRVQSLLLRELRRLPNVVVSDDEPDYVLTFLGFPNLNENRVREIGFTLSWIVTQPFRSPMLRTFSAGFKVDTKYIDLVVSLTSGLARLLDHQVRVGPPDKLQKNCEELISDFDVNTLEPGRKAWQKMKDAREKR